VARDDRVIFSDFVPDENCRQIYEMLLCLFSSLYEAWLAPLEAMTYGIPSLFQPFLSAGNSKKRVNLFDPENYEEMARPCISSRRRGRYAQN